MSEAKDGKPSTEDNDSDVEIEGMDMDGDDDVVEGAEKSAIVDEDVAEAATDASAAALGDEETNDKLATEDHDELEAAKRERMELMEAERKKVASAYDDTQATQEERLQYLLAQSEVFAHFLAGKRQNCWYSCVDGFQLLHLSHTCVSTTMRFSFALHSIVSGSVAASSKKGKNGSRGKKGRMTEAEEDAQMLKSAQSKRRVIRLDKQPSILASYCKMHPYQLEGLNWLIKLHCNGVNGILADEMGLVRLIYCLLHVCATFCFARSDAISSACSHHILLFRNYRVKLCKQFRSWHIFERSGVLRVPTSSLCQRVLLGTGFVK